MFRVYLDWRSGGGGKSLLHNRQVASTVKKPATLFAIKFQMRLIKKNSTLDTTLNRFYIFFFIRFV